MKTITDNETNRSKYLFEDDKAVSMSEARITVGNPDSAPFDPSHPNFWIDDLNSGNATLHENVTNAPEDWEVNKYTFDGTTWAQDSNWVDPDA